MTEGIVSLDRLRGLLKRCSLDNDTANYEREKGKNTLVACIDGLTC